MWSASEPGSSGRKKSRRSSLSELAEFDNITGPDVKVMRKEMKRLAEEVYGTSRSLESIEFGLMWPENIAEDEALLLPNTQLFVTQELTAAVQPDGFMHLGLQQMKKEI